MVNEGGVICEWWWDAVAVEIILWGFFFMQWMNGQAKNKIKNIPDA